MKGTSSPLRSRILEFIVILIAAGLAALVVSTLVNNRAISESYALPIYAVIVLVGGYLVIRIVNRIFERIVEPTLGVTRTRGFKNLFQVVAAIILVSFVFTLFGVNLTAVLIGAGFLGIVLGLAAQQVLGNIFAGFSLLVSKPFEIGDRVRLATSSYGLTGSTYAHESEPSGFIGVVQDIGIFITRVLLDNGLLAVFPNSVVIGSLIVNYSKVALRTVRVRMDLDNKLDYDKFKSRLLEALKKYDTVEVEESSVEIVDVAATTYQVVIAVWTRSDYDEPVKTLIIREAMKVRDEVPGT